MPPWLRRSGDAPASDALRLRTRLEDRDRDEIQALLESTGMFYPHEIEVALELVDDGLKRGERSDYHFLLAELAGQVVGYICYGPILVTDRRFDVYWIAVRRDRQGRGIGRDLLTGAEGAMAAAGGNYLYIETSSRPVYAATRGFYLKQGYREVARVPFYYGDDDDRVIYMKALGERGRPKQGAVDESTRK